MTFVPSALWVTGRASRDSGIRTRSTDLSNFARRSKPTIHNSPKGSDGLCFLVEEILEKAGLIQRWRIRIALSVISDFGDPIARFSVVEYGKKSGWIQERTSRIVQNAEVIRFDADDDVWLPEGKIAISRIPFLEFDNHRLICTSMSSTLPIPECSYQ